MEANTHTRTKNAVLGFLNYDLRPMSSQVLMTIEGATLESQRVSVMAAEMFPQKFTMPRHPYLNDQVVAGYNEYSQSEEGVNDDLDHHQSDTLGPAEDQITNRQQAILSLLNEEISSMRELEQKLYEERSHREAIQEALLSEKGRRKFWEAAFHQCSRDAETQLMKNEEMQTQLIHLTEARAVERLNPTIGNATDRRQKSKQKRSSKRQSKSCDSTPNNDTNGEGSQCSWHNST